MSKNSRIFEIFMDIWFHGGVSREDIMEKYNVSKRTAYADISDLRIVLHETTNGAIDIVNGKDGVYELNNRSVIRADVVYATFKVLVESRAFTYKELVSIFTQMLSLVNKEGKQFILASMQDELHYYKPIASNNHKLIPIIYQIENAIHANRLIKATYVNHDLAGVQDDYTEELIINPLYVYFSGFYFRLAGFVDGENRDLHVDWLANIDSLPALDARKPNAEIHIGQERYRSHLVYNREHLTTIELEWYSLKEWLVDRFPQTKILDTINKPNPGPFDIKRPVYLAQLEVNYNYELKMWLLSESECIKVLKPQWLVDELREVHRAELAKYSD